MGIGKIATQAAHASLGACNHYAYRSPLLVEDWHKQGSKKICLQANKEEFDLIIAKLEKIKLIHYVVVDAGKTQVEPNTKTAIAIGPWESFEIDQVCGKLKLL